MWNAVINQFAHFAVALCVAIVCGVVALLLASDTAVTKRGVCLRYQGKLRAATMLTLIFFTILNVAMFVEELVRGGVDNLTFWVVGLFEIFSAILVIVAFRTLIFLDDRGIGKRSWYGRVRAIEWAEVESVVNRGAYQDFRVSGNGKRIAISHMMGGIDLFVAECRRRLKPEAYGKELDKPIQREMYMGW